MITTDKNTGLTLEEVRSGFLGRAVIYFLWKGNQLIAISYDKTNWRMASWITKQDLPN